MSHQSPAMDEAERQRLLQSIPKMEDFQNNLENIEPLKGGRRVGPLIANSQQSEDEKRHQKASFEKALKHSCDLDVYLEYLRWTVETFPQGNNNESQLLDLLRRTMDTFQNDARYAQDPRYLKCWLDYIRHARLVDGEAKELFVYLAKKGIGQDLPLYYEQYSLLFEGQEKYELARGVLDEGIRRLETSKDASERLQKYLENFNGRVRYKKQQISQQESQTQRQIRSLQQSGERMLLGIKQHSRDTRSISQSELSNMQNTSGSNHHNNSNSSSSRQPFGNATSLSATSQLQKLRPMKFQVFTDDQEPSPSSQEQPSQSTTSSSSSLDTIFPTTSTSASKNGSSVFSRNRKENTVPVERFAGTKLPQKLGPETAQLSVPKFEVFRDDAPSQATGSSSLHDPPNDRNYIGMDNNKDTHRTATTIPLDRRHRHQRDDNSSAQHHIPSSSRSPGDGTMTSENHLGILTSRLRTMKYDYIQTYDSAGKKEYMAAFNECLGASESAVPISFEEIRTARQVDRNGRPQDINGLMPIETEAIISCRIGEGREPTMDYTEETLRARESISGMLSKRGDDHNDGDTGDYRASPKRLRTYGDENS